MAQNQDPCQMTANVTYGGVEFLAGFCCVSFLPCRFFCSCCLLSTGAKAKALAPEGTAFGWGCWSALGVSEAAAAVSG
jgi:hypothetical protein